MAGSETSKYLRPQAGQVAKRPGTFPWPIRGRVEKPQGPVSTRYGLIAPDERCSLIIVTEIA